MTCFKKYSEGDRIKLFRFTVFLILLVGATIASMYGLTKTMNDFIHSKCQIEKILYSDSNGTLAVCNIGKIRSYCLFNGKTVTNVTMNHTYHCWHCNKDQEYLVEDKMDSGRYADVTLYSVLTSFLSVNSLGVAYMIWRKKRQYSIYEDI